MKLNEQRIISVLNLVIITIIAVLYIRIYLNVLRIERAVFGCCHYGQIIEVSKFSLCLPLNAEK